MVTRRVRELVEALCDGLTASAEQLQGLTEGEIQEVERDQDAPLTEAYRQFLEMAGRGAGRFLRGSDVFYPDLLGLGRAARELLEENQVAFDWTAEDRVIFMHQGYQFDFLRGGGADPEVWSYAEGADSPVPVASYSCFTGWLQAQVDQQTRAWARLVPWYEAQKAKPPGAPRVFFGRRNPDGSVTEDF